jgi:hypothetical protein
MCDYDKGGDTVTAIGLEFRPRGHIFWIASNTCQTAKTVPFLESLLAKMQQVSTTTTITPEEVDDLAVEYIKFATPTILKFAVYLSPRAPCRRLLTRCRVRLEDER